MITTWAKELDALLRAGQSQKALEFLQSKLRELASQNDNQSDAFVFLQNELGSLCRGLSDYAVSEAAFAQVLAALEARDEQAGGNYVVALLNIAGCHRLMGNYSEAMADYENAQKWLDIINANPSLPSDAMPQMKYIQTAIFNNMSLLFCDSGEYERALIYSLKAAEYIRSGSGDDHELATSYNNLASIYLKLERFAEAEDACHRALDIFEAMPQTNVHHAAALATYAQLRIHAGDLQAAEQALEQSMVETQHFFGRNSDYLAAERSLQTLREMRSHVAYTKQDEQHDR